MPDINRTESQFGLQLKMRDNQDGSYTQYEYPYPAAVALGTAGGPGAFQSCLTYANRVTNPTLSDIILYTIPQVIAATSQAIVGSPKPQMIKIAATTNLSVGQSLLVDPYGGVGVTEVVTIGAVNPVIDELKNVIANEIWAIFQNNHSNGVSVVGGPNFFLTDITVTGSPSTGNPLIMVKAIYTSSALISIGSQLVYLNQYQQNPKNGGQIFVGQVLDIDVVSGGNYEPVTVTAVTTNAVGTVVAFTATFTKSHATSCLIGVPIQGALINSTKGIEEVGLETQPVAPPGTQIAICIATFTGNAFYNLRGFLQ